MGTERHLLITGRPGVGKTTIIRSLAERLAVYRPAGFYTQEIRERGVRQGFQIVTLNGRTRLLAHVEHRGSYRVGRYGVDLEGFEALLRELDLPRASSQMILIDEIGKMECLSHRFCEDVRAVLRSSKILIATIALRGSGFIAEVKHRPDCLRRNVTVHNRDHLLGELVSWVQARLDQKRI